MERVGKQMNWGFVIAASPEEEIGYIRSAYDALSSPLVLCAEGGLQKAEKLGIPCDILIGDMDSGGGDGAKDVMRFPMEKDFTDTQSCLEEAVRRGCSHVLITGATGGRLDHLLCNLHLLEALEKKGVHGLIADRDNLVQLLESGPVQVPACYRYFSILPIDEQLRGVTIEGAKYPLQDAMVQRDDSLTVSNEAPSGEVTIQVKEGRAFLIFSR